MLATILSWLSKGPLDRVLSTVDKKIEAETDKQALKADIIKTHYQTRGDYMRSGGFWLMMVFACPLGAWWSAVLLYSILWCNGCAFPQDWHIAALPSPLDEWAGGIVLSIFGVLGLDRFRR